MRHNLSCVGCISCPVCTNHTFVEGELVDVGVGSVQVSAGYCPVCGFAEYNEYTWKKGDHTLDTFIKCWELQVAPWPGMEECDAGSNVGDDCIPHIIGDDHTVDA